MSAKSGKQKSKKTGVNYFEDARQARTFRTGGSTAVRIPRDFQMEDTDLMITRVEDGLLITRAPQVKNVADWWGRWEADPGFMAEGRQQPAMQARDFGG